MTEPVEPPQPPEPQAGLPPAPVATAPGFPTWKQSIIVIVSGAGLALTTCFGFLIFATSNSTAAASEAWAGFAIAIVAIGALGAVGGVLMLFWLIGRALFGRPTR